MYIVKDESRTQEKLEINYQGKIECKKCVTYR